MGESSGVSMWPNQMGVILDAILVNYGGVFKWPTEVGEILCATWVNQVGYLSGLLKWVRFCLQYQ